MLANALSASVVGVDGLPVRVEVDVSFGLPGLTIVGLAGSAVLEARERVRAALRNSGFEVPARRITVNLAPADLPKEGTGHDLAMAAAILADLARSDEPDWAGGKYSADKGKALKAKTFDRVALGARGLNYERLDQLTIEILMGAR